MSNLEMWIIRIAYIALFLTIVILATRHSRKRCDEHKYIYHEEQPTMTNNITTLKLHSLKELIVLRKTVQDRMNLLQAAESTMPYSRAETIEYLTLGQILVRLPDPSLLTPHTCTQEDIPS